MRCVAEQTSATRRGIMRILRALLASVALVHPSLSRSAESTSMQRVQVSILVYHRFAPVSTNDMTVTTPVFESQMKQLVENGYKVIRLDQLVAYLSGNAAATPACSAVITADDGHRSIYTDMAPIVERYGIPVTLFVYPSAISNAVWAMTWDDLRELQGTGLFDIQSHTFWHPNFPHESKHLDFAAYQRFVDFQLTRSKAILQERLRTRVDMLAWPFGIYDDWLMARAQEAGYVAGFTLGRLAATGHDRLMALPRFLVTNQDHGRAFERLLDCDMRK